MPIIPTGRDWRLLLELLERVVGLEGSRHAGQGTAGADTADKAVDLTVGLFPDFTPGGGLVDG